MNKVICEKQTASTRVVIAAAGCQNGVLTFGLDGYAMRLVIGQEY